MTVVSLQKRLATLEKARASAVHQGPPPFYDGLFLLDMLIAVHLGGMTKGEAPVAAGARALGYASVREMTEAERVEGDPVTGWTARQAAAVERLLALRGVERVGGMKAVHEGLRSAFEAIPAEIREARFRSSDVDRALYEAAEWLCM